MHQSESVLEIETHKILWNFEIQTNYLIPNKRLDLLKITKKKKKKKKKNENLPYRGLCCYRQILGPCQRTKKALENDGDGDTNCNCMFETLSKALERELEKLEIGKPSGSDGR